MMKTLFRLLPFAAVAIGIGAEARADMIDCTKTASSVEKLICGDPRLKGRDAILDKLYAAAVNGDAAQKIADEQRRWRLSLDACGDSACVVSRYDARIVDLMESKGGQSAPQRVYAKGTHGKDGTAGDDGTLVLFGPINGVVGITLGAIYYGPNSKQTGDINADGMSGVAEIRHNRGIFIGRDEPCKFALRRLSDAAWKVTEIHGKTCWHAAVGFDGIYRLQKPNSEK